MKREESCGILKSWRRLDCKKDEQATEAERQTYIRSWRLLNTRQRNVDVIM